MKKEAQTTVETAVLMAIVAAALVIMGAYFTRSVSTSWRTNVDSFSEEQYNFPDADEALPDAGQSTAVSLVTFSAPRLRIEVGHLAGGNFISEGQVLDKNCGESNGAEFSGISWGTQGALIKK